MVLGALDRGESRGYGKGMAKRVERVGRGARSADECHRKLDPKGEVR